MRDCEWDMIIKFPWHKLAKRAIGHKESKKEINQENS
jgi:hypothetical protein